MGVGTQMTEVDPLDILDHVLMVDITIIVAMAVMLFMHIFI